MMPVYADVIRQHIHKILQRFLDLLMLKVEIWAFQFFNLLPPLIEKGADYKGVYLSRIGERNELLTINFCIILKGFIADGFANFLAYCGYF